MNTIKYLQLFSILGLIISLYILDLSYIRKQYQHEGYYEFESVDKGSGLPLSVLTTITMGNNTSYKEIGEGEIRNLTSPLVNMVVWGTTTDPVTAEELSYNDNDLLKLLSEDILSRLNKQLDASEPLFTMVNHSINSKHTTSSQEYIIASQHLIYREGKMYGFILDVESLWTNPKLELKGFTKVTPTGIVMEDNIFMLRNDSERNNYRDYGDNLSFIQGEAIMKDQEYEEDVSQRQRYGLLQDRGISTKSFAND